MRIEEITKRSLEEAKDLELTRLRYKMSKYWDRHFKNNDNETVGPFQRADFVAKYRLVLKASESRKLSHSTSDIDRMAYRQVLQVKKDGIDLAPLHPLETDQPLAVLDESFAKTDEIKVTIRSIDADSFCKALEEQVSLMAEEQFGKKCVFEYEDELDGTGIPLFWPIVQPASEVKKMEFTKPETVEESFEFLPVEKGEEQIVYGVVYEPDTVDAQGDKASAEEIRKAAYHFMENGQSFKVMHKGKKVDVKILENYIAPVDFELDGCGRKVKKGSWVLVTRVMNKKLWEGIKDGKLTGYSMAGYAKTS